MNPNWNKLSEEAKLVFFDFYLFSSTNKKDIDYVCPTDNVRKVISKKISCEETCFLLFPEMLKNTCPCIFYESKAKEPLKILEECLIEDGWFNPKEK